MCVCFTRVRRILKFAVYTSPPITDLLRAFYKRQDALRHIRAKWVTAWRGKNIISHSSETVEKRAKHFPGHVNSSSSSLAREMTERGYSIPRRVCILFILQFLWCVIQSTHTQTNRALYKHNQENPILIAIHFAAYAHTHIFYFTLCLYKIF